MSTANNKGNFKGFLGNVLTYCTEGELLREYCPIMEPIHSLAGYPEYARFQEYLYPFMSEVVDAWRSFPHNSVLHMILFAIENDTEYSMWDNPKLTGMLEGIWKIGVAYIIKVDIDTGNTKPDINRIRDYANLVYHTAIAAVCSLYAEDPGPYRLPDVIKGNASEGTVDTYPHRDVMNKGIHYQTQYANALASLREIRDQEFLARKTEERRFEKEVRGARVRRKMTAGFGPDGLVGDVPEYGNIPEDGPMEFDAIEKMLDKADKDMKRRLDEDWEAVQREAEKQAAAKRRIKERFKQLGLDDANIPKTQFNTIVPTATLLNEEAGENEITFIRNDDDIDLITERQNRKRDTEDYSEISPFDEPIVDDIAEIDFINDSFEFSPTYSTHSDENNMEFTKMIQRDVRAEVAARNAQSQQPFTGPAYDIVDGRKIMKPSYDSHGRPLQQFKEPEQFPYRPQQQQPYQQQQQPQGRYPQQQQPQGRYPQQQQPQGRYPQQQPAHQNRYQHQRPVDLGDTDLFDMHGRFVSPGNVFRGFPTFPLTDAEGYQINSRDNFPIWLPEGMLPMEGVYQELDNYNQPLFYQNGFPRLVYIHNGYPYTYNIEQQMADFLDATDHLVEEQFGYQQQSGYPAPAAPQVQHGQQAGQPGYGPYDQTPRIDHSHMPAEWIIDPNDQFAGLTVDEYDNILKFRHPDPTGKLGTLEKIAAFKNGKKAPNKPAQPINQQSKPKAESQPTQDYDIHSGIDKVMETYPTANCQLENNSLKITKHDEGLRVYYERRNTLLTVYFQQQLNALPLPQNRFEGIGGIAIPVAGYVIGYTICDGVYQEILIKKEKIMEYSSHVKPMVLEKDSFQIIVGDSEKLREENEEEVLTRMEPVEEVELFDNGEIQCGAKTDVIHEIMVNAKAHDGDETYVQRAEVSQPVLGEVYTKEEIEAFEKYNEATGLDRLNAIVSLLNGDEKRFALIRMIDELLTSHCNSMLENRLPKTNVVLDSYIRDKAQFNEYMKENHPQVLLSFWQRLAQELQNLMVFDIEEIEGKEGLYTVYMRTNVVVLPINEPLELKPGVIARKVNSDLHAKLEATFNKINNTHHYGNRRVLLVDRRGHSAYVSQTKVGEGHIYNIDESVL